MSCTPGSKLVLRIVRGGTRSRRARGNVPVPNDPADLFEFQGDADSLSDEFVEALAGLLLEIEEVRRSETERLDIHRMDSHVN
jgi:hypothetical protein